VNDDQRARERDERRRKRNERRRAKGLAAWEPAGSELVPDFVTQETVEAAATVGSTGPAAMPRRRLAVSSAIFGLATALSRVLGLVREMVASYYFGVSGRINAFTVAFQIPNLVRALVADAALSSSFVPVFSDLLEKGDRRRAWRVASSLFWLMLLGLTALTAIYILIAPWVVGIFGNPGHDRPLAVGLSQVLFPIVALLGVSGIVVGILNSYDHFTVPALSPVFWNIAIIAGLAIGVPQAHSGDSKLYIYAASILGATFIQVFLPMPWLRSLDRGDNRLRVLIDWHDPAVWRVFRMMVPVTLGLGLININAVIDTFFASRLINGNIAPSAISKAFLIYMLPQGMFSVAVATVLFPTLARLASRGDMAGFTAQVSNGLRQIVFLLAPAAVVSATLAQPIVRLLYQRGAFHPQQVSVVAGALAAFSAGLVFNGTMLMLNRAFFSLQSNWIPTAVALANLFLNALLDLAFYHLGTWGLPLSTALVNVAGSAALLYLLRRRIGRLDGRAIIASVSRILAASVLVAGVSYGIWEPLDAAVGRSFPAQVLSLGVALGASAAVYFWACRALRVREMQALLSLRRHLNP
jgi:putative peptidoglycan lipid II flippase